MCIKNTLNAIKPIKLLNSNYYIYENLVHLFIVFCRDFSPSSKKNNAA
jgi:hypothetical protein